MEAVTRRRLSAAGSDSGREGRWRRRGCFMLSTSDLEEAGQPNSRILLYHRYHMWECVGLSAGSLDYQPIEPSMFVAALRQAQGERQAQDEP